MKGLNESFPPVCDSSKSTDSGASCNHSREGIVLMMTGSDHRIHVEQCGVAATVTVQYLSADLYRMLEGLAASLLCGFVLL